MAEFTEVTANLLVDHPRVATYLERGQILSAKRGGTFVRYPEIAPEDCRRIGIILPKGGMIIPTIEPEALKALLATVEEVKASREGAKGKRFLEEAFERFAARNDIGALRALMESPACRRGDLTFHTPEEVAAYRNAPPEYAHRGSLMVGVSRTRLEWLIGLNPAEHLLSETVSVADAVVAGAYSKRLERMFEVTPEGIGKLDLGWQAAEDADEDAFFRIVHANPERAVVTRDGRSLWAFGVEYRFSDLVAADQYHTELGSRFFFFCSEDEADLALRIVAGEQPRNEEREEEWKDGPKMWPEGNGRYVGGTEKVTITLLGPHRIFSTGDDLGSYHFHRQLVEKRARGVNIKPRLNANEP